MDIWTSGLPRVAGVDGKRDAVIGVDGRRYSPRCEILLGPPWWCSLLMLVGLNQRHCRFPEIVPLMQLKSYFAVSFGQLCPFCKKSKIRCCCCDRFRVVLSFRGYDSCSQSLF